MAETARYHLGRVIKLGELTSERLSQALAAPVTIRRGEYLYTFTDIYIDTDLPSGGYIFARLTKYRPTGEVQVVVPEEHVAAIADIPNLLYASSPFVYLPEFAGIAYQHVWNRLQYTQFEKMFKALVEDKFQGVLVGTSIEPVADLRTFIQRVSQLDSILSVEATVHPPNPLFGPLWENLREYMRNRNAAEVKIGEQSRSVDGLTTNLNRLARSTLDRGELTPGEARDLLGAVGPGIADSAVLMAADGYGKATVKGRSGSSTLTIRTSQSQLSFAFAKEPEPVALYDEVRAMFARLNDERDLRHQ